MFKTRGMDVHVFAFCWGASRGEAVLAAEGAQARGAGGAGVPSKRGPLRAGGDSLQGNLPRVKKV